VKNNVIGIETSIKAAVKNKWRLEIMKKKKKTKWIISGSVDGVVRIIAASHHSAS